jgi:hypothetical protein
VAIAGVAAIEAATRPRINFFMTSLLLFAPFPALRPI